MTRPRSSDLPRRTGGSRVGRLLGATACLAAGLLGGLVLLLDSPGPREKGSLEESRASSCRCAELQREVESLRTRLSLLERGFRDSVVSRGVRLDLGDTPVTDHRALPPESSGAFAGSEARLGEALREGTLSLLDRAHDSRERQEIAELLLDDDHPLNRLQGVAVLLEENPELGLQAVRDMAEGVDHSPRSLWMLRRAIGLVGEQETSEAECLLRDLYRDAPTSIRVEAARSLEARGASDLMRVHLAEVATDLGSADVGTRSRAIAALGRSRSTLAADHLLPMLGDIDSEVRLRALEALRDCGDERTADAIRSLLDDSVAAVRERASGVLASLRAEPADGSGDRGEFKPQLRRQ